MWTLKRDWITDRYLPKELDLDFLHSKITTEKRDNGIDFRVEEYRRPGNGPT